MFFFFDVNQLVAPNMSGLVAWYDFSNSTYLTLAGSAITQALDRSGSSNDTAVQGTAAARPTVSTNQQNGLQTATFDGGDFLNPPSALYSLANGDNTAFVVAKRNTEDGAAKQIFSFGTSPAGANRYNLAYNTTSGSIAFRCNTAAGALSNNGNTNTNYQLITAFRSGVTQSLQVNNGTPATNSGATSNSDVGAASIGAISIANSFFLTGGIGEMLFYNRALSATEIVQNNRYLLNKWGL